MTGTRDGEHWREYALTFSPIEILLTYFSEVITI